MNELGTNPSLILKDLNICYEKLQETGYVQGDHGRTMMGIIFHAKKNNWIDDDFLQYWFTKLINAPIAISMFYLEKENYQLFGHSPESLSQFLSQHCDFLLKRGYQQLSSDMIKIALENDCFFDCQLLEQLEDDEQDLLIYKNRNSRNFSLHLENMKEKNTTKKIKV